MITRRRLLAGVAGMAVGAAPLVRGARALSLVDASTVVDTVRPLYDVRAMLIGESLAQMMEYTQEAAGFSQALKTGDPGVINAVEIISGAAGGSISCKEQRADIGSNYWVNYNTGTLTDGPLLTTVLTEIARRVATLAGRPPSCFLYELGFNEVGAMAGNEAGLSADQALIQHNASVTYMFSRLQAALLPSWGPVFIYIVPLGRATGGGGSDSAGYDAVRRAQLTTLLALPNTVRVADIYDMGVETNVHPARNWQVKYGARQANALLVNQYGLTQFWTGPTITSLSQPTTTTVEVHIAAESGDTVMLPTNTLGPCGFAFYDGTTRLTATFSQWHNGNPQWTLNTAPGALKMSFPSGAMDDFAVDRLILGASSKLPLASKYI